MNNFYTDLDLIFNDNEDLEYLKIKIIEAFEKNKHDKSNNIAKSIIPINFKFINGQIVKV
jgi:hypothetical protein